MSDICTYWYFLLKAKMEEYLTNEKLKRQNILKTCF